MKWLATFLVICTIAVAISISSVGQHGQVQIFIPPNTQITLSLNLAIFLILVGFLLVYALIRFSRFTLDLPEDVRRYRLQRNKKRSKQNMRQAIVSMLEGQYAQTVNLADKALEFDEQPAFNRLIAARAVHHLGQIQKRDLWFAEAEQDKQLKNAVEVSRAAVLFDTSYFEQAETAIERIPEKQRSDLANRLLIKSALARGDWAKVLVLLRNLSRQNTHSKDQLAILKRTAEQHLLEDGTVTPEQLTQYWRMTPDDERSDPYILAAFVQSAIQLENYRFARTLLENTLEKDWNSDLAKLYGTFIDPDAATSQIERAEQWLEQHPDDANLLFALGELCYARQLWGKAKNYLEASLAIEPATDTQLALARLLEQLGETERAHHLFREVALNNHLESDTI